MFGGSEADFNVVGQALITADPNQVREALSVLQTAGERSMREAAEAMVRAQERGWDQMTKLEKEQFKQTQKSYDKRIKEATKFSDQLLRLTKQREDDIFAEEARRRRRNEIAQEGRWQKSLQEQRRMTAKVEGDEKRHTAVVTQEARQRSIQLQADLQRRNSRMAIAEQGAQQRSIHRTESFHNALRESWGRFEDRVTHAYQTFWQRRHENRLSAQATERAHINAHNDRVEGEEKRSFAERLGFRKRHQDQVEGAMRAGYAQQEQIVTRSMVKQQGAINSFQKQAEVGLVGSLRRITLAVGGTYAAVRLLQPGFQFNVLQQQARMALTTLLGTEDAADQLLGSLREFAKTTPFPLENYLQATQKMVGFGVASRDVIPYLDVITDSVAAFGGGAEELDTIVDVFAKIQANGKITAEELNRLGDVGVNGAQLIGQAYGMTGAEIRTEISKGAVDADMALTALTAGMEERYGGAAAALKTTWTGALDRVKAAWRDLTASLMTPLIDPAGGGLLVDLANYAADALRILEGFVTDLMTGSGIYEVIRDGIMGVAAAMGALLAVKAAPEVFKYLKIALNGLTAHPGIWAIAALGAAVSILWQNVPEFREFIQTLADLGMTLVNMVLTPIREFASTVIEITRAGYMGMMGEQLDTWGVIFYSIGEAARFVVDNLGLLVDAFMSLLEFDVQGAWDSLREFFSGIGEALAPAVDFIATFLREAINRAVDWVRSGGIGDIVSAITEWVTGVVEEIRTQFQSIDWQGLVQQVWGDPLLQAITVVGGIVAAGMVVNLLAPFTLGLSQLFAIGALGAVIVKFWDDISEFIVETGWPALRDGLRTLAAFITDTAITTVFSRQVMQLALYIGGLAVVIGYELVMGIIDGLKRAIPQVVRNIRDIVNPIIQSIRDSFSDILSGIPVFSDIFVILEGILPTIELIADALARIPSLVYAVGAAFFLLRTRIKTMSADAVVGFRSLREKLDVLILRIAYAGDQVSLMGAKMQAAARSRGMTGAAMGMDNLGRFAQTAGRAISGVAFALPAIGTAAAIGLPVALGFWERAKQATAEWNNEVKTLAQSMREFAGGTQLFITTRLIDQIDGMAEALNDVGIEVSDFATLAVSSTDEVGQALANMAGDLPSKDGGPMWSFVEFLDQAGISMDEFGAAAVRGDQAVRDLVENSDMESWANAAKDAFKEIPEGVRDTIDQLEEGARKNLEWADATGQLTDSQRRLWGEIQRGETTQVTAIELWDDVERKTESVKRAQERHTEEMKRFREETDRAYDSTSLFRDQIQLLAGDQLSLRDAERGVEEAQQRLFEQIAEGGATIDSVGANLDSLAENMLRSVDVINNEEGIEAANEAYARYRRRLVDVASQFFDTREEAHLYVKEVMGIPPRPITKPEFDDISARQKLLNFEEMLDRLRRQDITITAKVRLEVMEEEGLLPPGLAESLILQEGAMANRAELAEGALVKGPTVALIGEAGPELVLPLTKPDRMAELLQEAGASSVTTGMMSLTPNVDSTATDKQIEIFTQWVERIAKLLERLVEKFTETGIEIVQVVRIWTREVVDLFGLMITDLQRMATQGGTRVVNNLTSVLRDGRSEVRSIVRGYATDLKATLDPLLVAIGEPKINLQVSERGNINEPRIATPTDGTQVHVFNEGRAQRYGEAYIPFQPSNRARSRQIASQAVSKLGGNVQWFQEGGITQPVPMVTGNWRGLHPVYAQRLSAWASSLGTPYHVSSGYRSMSEQAGLYAAYLAGRGNLAAPPGSSLHNYGLATDGPHWAARGPGQFGVAFPIVNIEPWHAQVAEGRAFLDGHYGVFGDITPLAKPPRSAGERGELSRLAMAYMKHLYDKAMDWATDITFDMMPDVGDAFSRQQAAEWIRTALTITGAPLSWLAPMLEIAYRESSFNPRAENLTGAGAAAGYPKGLFQTVLSTFAAYKRAGMDNIFDPVHNAVAAINYMRARYGGAPQAWAYWQTHHSYGDGGLVTKPTFALVGEDGPEMILPLTKPDRLAALLGQLSGGSLIDTSGVDLSGISAATNSVTGGAPIIGEMHVHSNATDPDVVASKAASKINDIARSVRG